MSTLLALYTCHAYDYYMNGMVCYPKHLKADRRPAIKKTWLQDVDIDYKWFFGGSDLWLHKAEDDEVFLPCNDGYFYLTHKTQEIARWALEHGYDRVFKVDDDTFLHWDRFKARPGFSEAEYSGGCWNGSKHAYGGCYVMAGRLLEKVASTEIGSATWGEDAWVGSVAESNGIPFLQDDSFYYGPVNPHTETQVIDDSLLRSDHKYAALNPLTPTQMLWYYKEKHVVRS